MGVISGWHRETGSERHIKCEKIKKRDDTRKREREREREKDRK